MTTKVRIEQTEEPLVDPGNQFITMSRDAGADIFDPHSSLCDDQGCAYQVDGVSIYLNKDHIAPSQAGIFNADLIKTLGGQ